MVQLKNKNKKKHIMTVLECMNLDYELRIDHPTPLTSNNTVNQRVAFKKWEQLYEFDDNETFHFRYHKRCNS